MNQELDRYYLELALEEAEIAFNEGTIPIGAVLVDPDGNVLSKGRNRVFTNSDPTKHAEIDVIRQAGLLLMDTKYKNKCTLYSTP
jgi:tRNA(adenine34) deaminase